MTFTGIDKWGVRLIAAAVIVVVLAGGWWFTTKWRGDYARVSAENSQLKQTIKEQNAEKVKLQEAYDELSVLYSQQLESYRASRAKAQSDKDVINEIRRTDESARKVLDTKLPAGVLERLQSGSR